MGEVVERSLGKYQLISLEARGGMAEVYKAYQPGLDRYVAVKLLHPHLADEPGFIARFEREAASVARLRHPNIVQVIDFDRQDGRYYMVMEFIEGDSLKDELSAHLEHGETYTPDQAAYVISGVASALDYAHERGMVHRDIKPGNILFTGEGQVVLADFGIAHIIGTTLYTESAGALGTPAYISPEQGTGDMGDARSDIYSLGVVFYQMLTGYLPFEADTPLGLIQQHIQADLIPPRQLIPDLPETVEAVILKTLAKDPQKRFQRAGEMVEALSHSEGLSTQQVWGMPMLEADELTEAQPKPLPPCPYRGLFAFREEDAPFFFGREVFTDQLIDAVENRSLVAVVGPSGSGKSSVVRAGLLPHMRQAAGLRGAHGHAWLIAELRPGAKPFHSLAKALLPLLEGELSMTDQLVETRKLANALENGEALLGDVIGGILHKSPEHGRLLLVIDQFEELYTLVTPAENVHRFVEILLDPLDDNSDMTLVFTLRADFLGEAFSNRRFADALQNTDLKLGPMKQEELAQAIENPACRLGVVYEAGLVERILEDVGQEHGNLPLLEFALTQLWEEQKTGQLTHAAYEAIGRVQGALAHYADQVFADFDASQQEQARHIFTQLVRPGEGVADTRRLARRSELGEGNWRMVQKLADTRLVITGSEAVEGQETVEVVHEALIQGWGQLREWMVADRLFRTWQERLRAAIHQWEAIDRESGALLRGAPLAEAEGWLGRHPDKLSEEEIIFIQASVDLRESRQRERDRRRRITFLALVGGLIVALALALVAFQQRQDALRQVSINLALRVESEFSGIYPEQAVPLALGILEDYPYTWQAERALGNAVMANRLQMILLHDEEINVALWSPDGTRILTASDGDTAVIWDAASGEVLHTLSEHTDDVDLASWSPDGELVITAGPDGTARLWDSGTGEQLAILIPADAEPGIDPVRITVAAVSPDGRLIATGSADGTIKVWDINELEGGVLPEVLFTLSGHRDQIDHIAWSPDASRIVTIDESSINLWEVRTGMSLSEVEGAFFDADWSSDSQRIILSISDFGSAIEKNFVYGYRILPDGGSEYLFRIPNEGTFQERYDVQMGPDGTRFVTYGSEELIAWNAITGEEQYRFGGSFQLWAFDWSPDGTQFVSAGPTGEIIVWDAGNGTQRLSFHGHQDVITSLEWSPTGYRILSSSLDGTARVWYTNEAPLTISGPDAVMCTDVSLQGDFMGVAYFDGTVKVYEIPAGDVLLDWTDNSLLADELFDRSCQLALSPEGTRIVIVSGGFPNLWDMRATQQSTLILGHTDFVDGVVWSPDGRRFATNSRDETIRIWDGETGEGLLMMPTDLSDGIFDLNWSPDGEQVMLANFYEGKASIKFWDAESGELQRQFYFETCQAQEAKLSSEGGQVAISCRDESVRIWSEPYDEQPVTIAKGIRLVGKPAWSPPGVRLLGVSQDGLVRMWGINTGEELLNLDFGKSMEIIIPPEGKRMALINSQEGKVSVFPIWGSLDELEELARECCVFRELTADERSLFGLPE